MNQEVNDYSSMTCETALEKAIEAYPTGQYTNVSLKKLLGKNMPGYFFRNEFSINRTLAEISFDGEVNIMNDK